MKTPEEIKMGLSDAPHIQSGTRYGVMIGYVQRDDIVACIDNLVQRLAQAERERDELEDECRSCGTCKFIDLSFTEHPCNRCVALGRRMMWQWRGVCEETSKEGNHG